MKTNSSSLNQRLSNSPNAIKDASQSSYAMGHELASPVQGPETTVTADAKYSAYDDANFTTIFESKGGFTHKEDVWCDF